MKWQASYSASWRWLLPSYLLSTPSNTHAHLLLVLNAPVSLLYHLLGNANDPAPFPRTICLSWRCSRPADRPCLSSVPSFLSSGVDSARVRQAGQIAGQSSTRRLGDYRVKFNYNEIDLLRWSQNTQITSYIRLLYRFYKGYYWWILARTKQSSRQYQDMCFVLLKGER